MAEYVLSKKADEDLDEIYVYSAQNFGEARADKYFLGLCTCLQTLADNPRMGREAAELNPGLLWHRHERHVIFYMGEDAGIFVVRVLHEAMDFIRHLS